MPISIPGSGMPSSPIIAPSDMTSGNVTGRIQIAGLPSCAPQSPTAIIASTWSRPDQGCCRPVTKPVACPRSTWAKAGEASSRTRAASRGTERPHAAARCVASSQPSEKDDGPLDRPVRPEAADRVSRQRLRPSAASGPRASGTTRSSSSDQRRRRRAGPTSTPTLKSSSASGISALGRPIALSPLAKPKPCSRPNSERHDPRVADREARLAAPGRGRSPGRGRGSDSAIAAFSGGSGALA